ESWYSLLGLKFGSGGGSCFDLVSVRCRAKSFVTSHISRLF
nr:hypothetical protein [Tanacetum cinerariifolium]